MAPGASPSSHTDVAIVGGGIAGLATAFELHKQRVGFILFEAQPRAGGVILSERIEEEFVVDAGPDSLLTQKPEGIALCRELGLGERLVPTLPPRTAYIQRGGRLLPLPPGSVLGIPTAIGPFATSPLFSWAGKLRMGAELFVPARRDDRDESVGAFMRRRFGHEAVTYLAEPLLAGIHAGDVDRLSIQALFPRLYNAERSDGSVLRAFRRRAHSTDSGGMSGGPAPQKAERDEGGAFRSLPGGLSELTDALVRALPADRIRLGAPVTRISKLEPQQERGPQFEINARGGAPIQANAVVLAAPAYATAPIVEALAPRLHALCAAIPYASTATVSFAFDRKAVAHPLNGTGFVVPKVEGTGILAASWLSSKWPHRAPPGRVLMRAFLGGARDPGALDATDVDLVSRALNALRPLHGITGEPLFTRVYRWPRANAQHEVGHRAQVAEIDRALAEYPGLFVTGSAYRGVGIPDCVADGRATGRQVASWLASTAGLTRATGLPGLAR